jgi:hypothetical protein
MMGKILAAQIYLNASPEQQYTFDTNLKNTLLEFGVPKFCSMAEAAGV